MNTTRLLLIPLALVAAACGDDDPDTADEAPAVTAAATTTTTTAAAATVVVTTPEVAVGSCDSIAATFVAGPSANADLPDPEVSATCDGDTITVTSNGIPDYPYVETSPGTPDAVDLVVAIPAEPTPAAETTEVPRLGTVAIALNGVPIYGPTEGTGGDVESLVGALSECGSHNGPTGFHIHQHGTSDTVECLFTPAEVAEEPQLVGYALDGYPIYTGNDRYTSSWQLTDESLFATDTWAAHTYVEGSGDLDECNGLTAADGSYAYYTTDTFPYVLGCYAGEVDVDAALVSGGVGGPPGDGAGRGAPGGPPPAGD